MKLLSQCCSALPLCFWVSVGIAQNDPAPPKDSSQNPVLDGYAVAVLPLKIVSDDPGAAEFAGAVREALNKELLSVAGLHVVGDRLVLPYSDSGLTPVEIARAVGVGSVVHGQIWAPDDKWAVHLVHGDASGGEPPRSSSMGFRVKRISSGQSNGLADVAEVRDRVAQFGEQVESRLFPERRPDRAQLIAEMQAEILDTSLSDAERVKALEVMPRVMNASPSYVEARSQALSGPVASALAQIATYSDDARLRMQVWRALTNVDDPGLVAPLLSALANDQSDGVRIEAARRLAEGFRDAPGVLEAIDYAAEVDPSERVRKSIRFATSSEEKQAQELRTTILDTSASFDARWSALREYHLNDGALRELDGEIIISMVEMARSTENPHYALGVWTHLIGTDEPHLVEPLIEELEADPGDDMKSLAVRELGRFLGYPGVREALERVAAQDASLKIRETARLALDGPDR